MSFEGLKTQAKQIKRVEDLPIETLSLVQAAQDRHKKVAGKRLMVTVDNPSNQALLKELQSIKSRALGRAYVNDELKQRIADNIDRQIQELTLTPEEMDALELANLIRRVEDKTATEVLTYMCGKAVDSLKCRGTLNVQFVKSVPTAISYLHNRKQIKNVDHQISVVSAEIADLNVDFKKIESKKEELQEGVSTVNSGKTETFKKLNEKAEDTAQLTDYKAIQDAQKALDDIENQIANADIKIEDAQYEVEALDEKQSVILQKISEKKIILGVLNQKREALLERRRLLVQKIFN